MLSAYYCSQVRKSMHAIKKPIHPFMRTKGHIFAVPPHFAVRLRTSALITLTVLHFIRGLSGLAIMGLPIQIYSSKVNFFCNQSERHSIASCCGGFQPMTSSSLSAKAPFTLPGGDHHSLIVISVPSFKRGVNTNKQSTMNGYNILISYSVEK